MKYLLFIVITSMGCTLPSTNEDRVFKAKDELSLALQNLAFSAGMEMEANCMLEIQNTRKLPQEIEICRVLHTKTFPEKMQYWKEHFDK